MHQQPTEASEGTGQPLARRSGNLTSIQVLSCSPAGKPQTLLGSARPGTSSRRPGTSSGRPGTASRQTSLQDPAQLQPVGASQQGVQIGAGRPRGPPAMPGTRPASAGFRRPASPSRELLPLWNQSLLHQGSPLPHVSIELTYKQRCL